MTADAYKYGYNVNPRGQFHHEVRGPHQITYGCYGYIDPFGQLKTIFYISDGWGYRIVQPGKNVELFFHKHEYHENRNNHDHNETHEHYGVFTPWQELHFPIVCAQYENENILFLKTSNKEGHSKFGTPVRPDTKKFGKSLYQGHLENSSTQDMSNIPQKSTSEEITSHFEHLEITDIPSTPGMPRTPGTFGKQRPLYQEYFRTHEITDTSDILDIPGTSGRPKTPSYSENQRTLNILTSPRILEKPKMRETSSYSKYSGASEISNISDTPAILGQRSETYPKQPVSSIVHVTPDTPRLSEKSGMLQQESGIPRNVPGTSSTPGMANRSKALSYPEYSGTPRILGISGTSNTSETFKKSGTLSRSEQSKISGISGILDVLGTSRRPEMPSYPEHSQTFGISDISDIFKTITKSKGSEMPLYRGSPETSGIPIILDTPDVPGISKSPVNSEYLATPRVPGILATSHISKKGGYNSVPGRSRTLSYPKYLETIEILGTSNTSTPGTFGRPKMPLYPGYQKTPGISDIPEIPQTSEISAERLHTLLYPEYTETSGIHVIPSTLGTLGKLEKLETSIYSKIPGISDISDISGTLGKPRRPGILSYSEYSGTSKISGTSNASRILGRPEVSSYSKSKHLETSGISSIVGTFNTSEKSTPSHPEYMGTSGIPEISEEIKTLIHSEHLGTSRIHVTPSIRGTLEKLGELEMPSYSGHAGISSRISNISGISGKSEISTYSGYSKTPEHHIIPSISGMLSKLERSKTPTYAKHPKISEIPDIPSISDISRLSEDLETTIYSEHPGVSSISGTFGSSGRPRMPSYLETFDNLSTPEMSEKSGSYSKYLRISNVSSSLGTSNILGIPGISSHSIHAESIIPKIRGKSGTPLHYKHARILNMSDTANTLGILGRSRTLFHPQRPKTFIISSTPRISDISGKSITSYPGYPIYPIKSKTPVNFEMLSKPDDIYSEFSNTSNKSSFPFKSGKSGYTYTEDYTEESKNPLGPISIEPHGEVSSKDPSSGIGGIGNVDNISDKENVGPNGPDGPWPTGSPGPNGPWPGDPDYISGISIKSTRKPLHKGLIRNHHSSIYSDTDKYNSVSQYSFNGTGISYTNYTKDNELLKLIYPMKVNTSLYNTDHNRYRPQYKIQSVASVHKGKEIMYNRNETNSLLQIGSTPSSLKYKSEDHQYTDMIKLNPQFHDHLTHTEPQQVKKPLKNEPLKHLSVHRSQYQKSIFYPFNNSQSSRGSNQFNKLVQQESAVNVDGRYNKFANMDNKSISDISTQDEPSSVLEKQVNVHLEQISRTNPVLDAIGVQPPNFINVKPFSLPIGPDSQACPCYLIESKNNTNVETSSTLTSVIGQFGFVPIIFVPYCPGNEMDSNKIKIMFPSITSVPYICDICDIQDSKLGIRTLDINQLGNIDYLKEILNQPNLGLFNVSVKNNIKQKRSKGRKTK
ncbi:mucin-12-like [Pogonomyrmex barbatus]|uniref:Mucin-12-like n=1 Tax=Pogonomyrmex barbatus TaxID=144034 RepID=A0A6I9W0W1_9HYME|nr:mucin-12-like [Pogonomyrmex barbatus]